MTTPFRNLRHALSLHASAAPDAPCLIDAASGVSFTYAEFNGLVHQSAGWLYDDVGVRPGDRACLLDNPALPAPILMAACWLIGAAVGLTPQTAAALPSIAADHLAAYPNTFIAMQGESPVTGDAPALIGAVGQPLITQADLLTAAIDSAFAQVLTARQRLLIAQPLTTPETVIVGLAAALVTGASIVWAPQLDAHRLWTTTVEHAVHIAQIDRLMLAGVTTLGENRLKTGASALLWGEGIGRHDLRRFRHCLIQAEGFIPAVGRVFEDRFGLPILTYRADATAVSITPIALTWEARRRHLYGDGGTN